MTISASPSDASLVEAALDGDLESFAKLYDRHFSAVYDFLSRLLRDRNEADVWEKWEATDNPLELVTEG